MSNHLPECERWFTNMPAPDECPACEMFRVCEQRVLAEREADGPWFRSVVHDCCVDKQTAYAAGLDAARDAVAATFIGWCKDYMNCTDYEHVCGKRREIITAIDALREAER